MAPWIPPPRSPGLQDLGRFRVNDILLVATLYDSFMLSEDGELSEAILREFQRIDTYGIPSITRVSTGTEALARTSGPSPYDLVITAMQVGDMTAAELVRRMRAQGCPAPVVALAYDARDVEGMDVTTEASKWGLDRVFLWHGDFRILPAIVRDVEDRRNVAVDTGELGVQAIILIEDNIRFYSSFLPALYAELVRHSENLAPEGLNLSQKVLRVRARPKVLLCHTYEEAWRYFERYADSILGVISDMEFPQHGELRPDAGLAFARMVRRLVPDVPIMLQSATPEAEAAARAVGAAFVQKGSPTLLHQLQQFMIENFGFGDFVFRLPDGREVARASTLKALEAELERVPLESIAYHGERNHFSNWLKARTEFALAHYLRPRQVSDFATVEDLRREIIRSIHEYRRRRDRGIVANFDPAAFDPETSLCRIGGDSLGGKGRGLALVNALVIENGLDTLFPGVRLSVPSAVVLGTEVFDRFLEANDLRDFAIECDDDQALTSAFLAAPFPADVEERLGHFLELQTRPLAVRSSSLLEDSRYQPFAGVYDTWMLPNDHWAVAVRLTELLNAVRRVYASTFATRTKTYFAGSPYRLEEEKMAVVIQRLVGARHGARYYPTVSGVARSHNFYPIPPAATTDGIAAVALGLGATVVGGDTCVQFCPRYPLRPAPFLTVESMLASGQREFFALRMDGPGGAGLAPERFPLPVAEEDGTLAWVGSTYSPENHAIYDGVARPGVRLVSFAPILKHRLFPLAEIVVKLLDVCTAATGTPVEIEFAIDVSSGDGRPGEFGFLQLRPLPPVHVSAELEIGSVEPARVLCRSRAVLGHGVFDKLRDIVVVDAERFQRGRSREVARDIAALNASLAADGRSYVLIGVGRWGSSEPLFGIPVTWDQIAAARVIVEAGFRDFRVVPSQGSHFFQNLVASDVGYFTVNPEAGEGELDWAYLAALPAQRDTGFVRLIRLPAPLVVKIDGRKGEGVILKPVA